MKNNGKSFGKRKFSSFKNDKRDFKKKDGKDSSSTQEIVCYECNVHRHLKKECPNYLRGKGKVLATTFNDSEGSNSDAEGECDSDGNYSAFMAITTVDSKDDLSDLVDELGVHFEGEEVDLSDDEDKYLNEVVHIGRGKIKETIGREKRKEKRNIFTLIDMRILVQNF